MKLWLRIASDKFPFVQSTCLDTRRRHARNDMDETDRRIDASDDRHRFRSVYSILSTSQMIRKFVFK